MQSIATGNTVCLLPRPFALPSGGRFHNAIQQGTAGLQIGLLVNNAGITTAGNVLDNDLGSELALLHVNNRVR